MNLKETQAVILAGGLGTRLRPITELIPKPMIEINGKPFLEYQINQIRDSGIENIVLCVGYLGEIIQQHFGDGKNFGVKIKYSHERELLGTAGAIKKAESFIDSNPFIVLNGDCYNELSLTSIFSAHQNGNFPITMAIARATNPTEQELVEVGNGVITQFLKRNTPEHSKHLKEKSSYLINAGVYILDREILGLIPSEKNFSLEQQIFPNLTSNMSAFYYGGYLKDLANVQFCNELDQYMKEKQK